VAYDIADDTRLRHMFRLLRGYGDHVQYSVFLCQLSEKDKVVLMEKIKDIIHHKEDQVILITLGTVDGARASLPEQWQVLGTRLILSHKSDMIY